MSGATGGAAGRDIVTQVLVVCEANRGRSPVLAQLLRREVERRGLGSQVVVLDAAVRGPSGEPMLPTVVRAARDLSLSLEDHRSQLLDPATVDPDLVLTMTEDQRRELVRRRPQTLHHTFTVREAVRLLDSSRWDPRWEGTSELVEQLHRLRPLVPAARGPEDVPDPVNGGRRLAAAVVAELQRYAPRLAQALWGPVPRGGTGPEAQTSTAGR